VKYSYLILFLITILLYGASITHDYNMDDELVSRDHPLTSAHSENGLSELFTGSYHQLGSYNYGYRPITLTTFYLEHRIFGESASVSHLINVILYALLVVILLYSLRIVFPRVNVYIRWFIALLFALHPIHTEVVCSIKNRDEILSLLFCLIGLLATVHWFKSKKMPWLILVIVGISFSILAKKSCLPVLFILPALFIFRYSLSFRQFLYLSAVFSIPLSVFAFNFQFLPGLLLFFVSNCFYSSCYYFKSKKSELNLHFFDLIVLLLSLSTLAFAILFKEWIFLLAGMMLILWFNKKRSGLTEILMVCISLMGYGLFYHLEYLLIALFLLSAGWVTGDNHPYSKWLRALMLLVVLIFIFFKVNSFLFTIAYLTPILVFSSFYLHRLLPFAISILVLIITSFFIPVNTFHFGLLLFAILLAFFTDPEKVRKYYLPLLAISLVLFIGWKSYVGSGNLGSYQERQFAKTEAGKQPNNKLEEGRKLEFIENTLVAPHTLEERLATGFLVMGKYLQLIVYPHPLSFYYGYAEITTVDFTSPKVWLSILAHLFLLFIIIYFGRHEPLILLGGIWYLTSIFLFSNWPALVAGMLGERLAFSASAGFCLMAGGLIHHFRPRFSFKKPRLPEVIAVMVLVALSVKTYSRTTQWKSAYTLMKHDISHLENSAQAHYLLGIHSIKAFLEKSTDSTPDPQQIQYSIDQFQRAIEIYPEYYNFHYDLGRAYLVISDFENAREAFYRAYQLEPSALLGLQQLAQLHFQLKEFEEAQYFGEKYLSHSSGRSDIYEITAMSAYFNGNLSKATSLTQQGLHYFPDNQNLIRLLQELGE
jgi:tetratricopeptide (TPR) repeat protein